MRPEMKQYTAMFSDGTTYKIDTRRDHLIYVNKSQTAIGPVCDACNDVLGYEVWILMLGLRPWGALCNKCIQMHKLPRYVLKVREAKLL